MTAAALGHLGAALGEFDVGHAESMSEQTYLDVEFDHLVVEFSEHGAEYGHHSAEFGQHSPE